MTNFNTELIESLCQGIDITELFRSQLEEAMTLLLEAERSVFFSIFNHMIPVDTTLGVLEIATTLEPLKASMVY